jgi:hypothetical protein
MYQYVWERLHVQGRRSSGSARRRRKFTDWYPFKNKKLWCKFRDFFDDLVESTLLAGGKSKKKEMEI